MINSEQTNNEVFLKNTISRVSKVGDPPVEGDQKAPFSIATTPSCRERRYPFPWIAP